MLLQRLAGLKSILGSDMDNHASPWPIYTLLFLGALLAYANSFPGAFLLDDLHIVRKNPLVADVDILAVLRSDYWHGVENSGLYRPLTILSLALNRALLGPAPFGFHLVNVLLHAVVAILLALSLVRWGHSRGLAFMAGALFAVHPLHTEVVNIVVGRSELLVALLLTIGLLCARREGWRADAQVGLCFLLALLAKEHAIVFVALLPLWETFHGQSWGDRRHWRRIVALALIAVAWLVLRAVAVVETLPRSVYAHEAAPLAHLPWDERVLTALYYQWLYLAKLLIPFRLQGAYSPADLPFISSPLSLAGTTVLAGSLVALALIVIGWRRRQPVALFATLYLVSFAPTSNLFLPIGVSFAERLAFYPSLWFCAGMAALFGLMAGGAGRARAAWLLFAAYLLVLAVLCVLRNPDFSSETRFWTAEVDDNPSDYLGWQNLAISLVNSRREVEAEAAFAQMLALAPDFPGGLRAWTVYLFDRQRYGEALTVAQRALEIARARDDLTAQSFDHVVLAEIYVAREEFARALGHLDQVDPRMGVTTRSLEARGRALIGMERYQEAAATIERIVGISPRSDIRFHYGLALLRLDRFDEARRELTEHLGQHDGAEGWNLLGVACALQKDWPAAVAAFENAVRRDPDNRRYRENLARAIGESSRP